VKANLPIVIGNLMFGRCFTMERIPFVGVTSNNDKRIWHSKFCTHGYSITNPAKENDKFFFELMKIGEKHGKGSPLYYTNDGHLKAILQHYEEIKDQFTVVLPSKEILEASLFKDRFYEFSNKFDLPMPPTIRSSDMTDIDNIDLPVVLKPLTRLNWFESGIIQDLGKKDYKVIYVDSKSDLKNFVSQFKNQGIDFVIQKYIAGDESNIISFHTFITEEGKFLGYYVGRKIRTNPPKYGLSSCLRLVEYPEVVEMSLEILRKINFKGPVKLDFKLDQKSGELFLLEINARYNMWHYIGARAGINLPALSYRYYSGAETKEPLTKYRTDIKWISFIQDVLSFLELYKKKELTLFQWLKSYKGKRIYQTLAFDDFKPVLYAMIQTIKGIFRRILRLFR